MSEIQSESTQNSLFFICFKGDILKSYEDNKNDTTSLNKQLDELKRWAQMPSNRQMLKTISFTFQTSFDAQLNRVILSVDTKTTIDGLKLYVLVNC